MNSYQLSSNSEQDNGVRLRHYIHYIISIYLVFGGLFTNNVIYLKIHFYVTLLTIIHWITNKGQCFLTETDYDSNDEPNGYTKHLLSLMNISPSSTNLMIIGWLSVILPCIYTLYKLNNINIHPYLLF